MFVFGQSHLTAVDSYNGAQLWKRRLSTAVCSGKGSVFADDDSVYVHERECVARFDAATGRLVQLYGPGDLSPVVHDGSKPLHFDTESRRGGSGAIEVDATGDALRITLTSRSPAMSNDDAWELALDFRRPEQRLLAPGPGSFELVVNARNGTLRPLPTFAHPAVVVEKRAGGEADTSTVVLSIPWADVQKAYGWKPTSFAMSADLKLWTPDLSERLWSRPLVGRRARLFNEAEAVIVVAKEAGAPGGSPGDAKVASPLLPVPVSAPDRVPAYARGPGRLPPLTKHRTQPGEGEYHADRKEGLGVAGEEESPREQFLRRLKGYELPSREQPVTGEHEAREYARSYGCSGTSSSAVMDFFRSGTIGMYDRLDDSGMRNISGVRSGCGLSLVPAHGMLLYSESAVRLPVRLQLQRLAGDGPGRHAAERGLGAVRRQRPDPRRHPPRGRQLRRTGRPPRQVRCALAGLPAAGVRGDAAHHDAAPLLGRDAPRLRPQPHQHRPQAGRRRGTAVGRRVADSRHHAAEDGPRLPRAAEAPALGRRDRGGRPHRRRRPDRTVLGRLRPPARARRRVVLPPPRRPEPLRRLRAQGGPGPGRKAHAVEGDGEGQGRRVRARRPPAPLLPQRRRPARRHLRPDRRRRHLRRPPGPGRRCPFRRRHHHRRQGRRLACGRGRGRAGEPRLGHQPRQRRDRPDGVVGEGPAPAGRTAQGLRRR